eukprot:1645885-Rhodomonas_salina.2
MAKDVLKSEDVCYFSVNDNVQLSKFPAFFPQHQHSAHDVTTTTRSGPFVSVSTSAASSSEASVIRSPSTSMYLQHFFCISTYTAALHPGQQ